MTIPFRRVHLTGREIGYVREAIESGQLSGDGPFTRRCEAWLQANAPCARAFLTHSGTAALEMAAILANAGPGDEIIMPSFTFPSTANAFVLNGATPVFVDIDPSTLCIDPARVANAVTANTKAIVPVHYAGVSADMPALQSHGILIIEDAAQALLAVQPGAMAAVSFHETKNVSAGEGGALLINDERFIDRAEIVREKGTNRAAFMRGEVEQYEWVERGSSFAPGELSAAFLLAQLEEARAITARGVAIWNRYHALLDGVVERPRAPSPNGHIYYVLMESESARTRAIQELATRGIQSVFHYVPLHSAPAGRRYGRTSGPMEVTEDVSRRLLRLPLWPEMADAQVEAVAEALRDIARR
ncbi:MAG TPA: dTDP-4-amino-4,6-dideoxygalactose transaminase [Thermoanaerobaculia bacterium]|nr:dTDP-4-amino-4,6-dideoxygalactose transaminase [Thermoanaerobaculia bacterium]